MKTDLLKRQTQDPAGAHEPPCDEEGAHGLCDQCGDGHAGYAEPEDQDEDGIQDNVDDAADDQDVQRAPGVPGGAQDGRAHIVDKDEQDPCKIDPEIGQGPAHDIRRCVHQVQHERRGEDAGQGKDDAAGHGYGIGRVKSFIGCLFLSRPDKLGDGHGGAGGKPGEEADHQVDDLGGGAAHAGKRLFSDELAHDHAVDRIV